MSTTHDTAVTAQTGRGLGPAADRVGDGFHLRCEEDGIFVRELLLDEVELVRVDEEGQRVDSHANPRAGLEGPLSCRGSDGFQRQAAGYDGRMTYAYPHGYGDIRSDFGGGKPNRGLIVRIVELGAFESVL